MEVARWRGWLQRHPLELKYREIAAREGLLLKYLAGDLDTISLVQRSAGQVLALYEYLDLRQANPNYP